MIKILIALFFVWIIVSTMMFIMTLGAVSVLNPSGRKTFWKWSLLLTFYIGVPIIGWMIGLVHLWVIVGKPKVITSKNDKER